MGRLSTRLGVLLSIRVGVSAGDVALEGGDCFGTPVVEAARLGAYASGGEIVVSDVVRVLAGTRSEVEFDGRGALSLKGFNEPVVAWAVRWEPTADEPLLPFPSVFAGDGFGFVGRQTELAVLTNQYAAARDGRRSAVFIGGEPGAGKTRLATEAAAVAHARGAVVLAGRCDEELAVPYQPFVEALRFFVAHAPDELVSSVDPVADDLTVLVPELGDRAAVRSERRWGDPEVERYRLFEAMASWLRGLSAVEPVLFVLDDLQWASKPTVLMLRHVLRNREPARLFVVGTYRESELPARHPFADLLTGLAADETVRWLTLEGLDETAIAQLLRAAAEPSGMAVDAVLCRDLAHRSGGNALFVTELVRTVAEQGSQAITTIPSSVRGAIRGRLMRLSETAQQVATVGAVTGLTFALDVVADVVAKQPHDLLDAFDELAAANIVVEERDGMGRYAFAHALVRAALTEALSETRRAFLHRDIARVIEATYGDTLDDHLAALAQHWAAAGTIDDRRRAGEFALRAGLRAASRFAPEEAETLYRLGLDAQADRPDRDQLRCELFLALADLLTVPGAVRETAREAFGIARELGLASHMAQAAALYTDAGEPGRSDHDAVEMSTEALDRLGDSDPELRSLVFCALATYHTVSEGDGPTGDECARESIIEARRLYEQQRASVSRERPYLMWELTRRSTRRDDEALLYALATRILALMGWSPVGERVALLEEMRLLSESHRIDDRHTAEMLRMSFPILIEAGQGARARADLDWFRELLTDDPDTRIWHFEDILVMYDGMLAAIDGRFDDASEFADKLFAASSRSDFAMSAGAQTALVLRERERLAEMRPLLDATVQRNPRISFAQALLGLAYVEEGDTADAAELLDRLGAEDFANVPHDSMWSASVALLAEIACVIGARQRAGSLYQLLSPFAGQMIVLSWGAACLGSADRYLGMLSASDELWDAARHHFESAIEQENRLQAPPLLARTQYWFARTLQRQDAHGNSKQVRSLLDEAIATASALGATELETRCLELTR